MPGEDHSTKVARPLRSS